LVFEQRGRHLEDLPKAKILPRLIAKGIDFIIVGALLETIPRVGYFAGMAYLAVGDGFFDGRSVGKKLIGLMVVKADGDGRCTYRESIIRNSPFLIGYVLMIIPWIGWLFPLIVIAFESLLIIGSKRGMRLGDEIAKTQVIEKQ